MGRRRFEQIQWIGFNLSHLCSGIVNVECCWLSACFIYVKNIVMFVVATACAAKDEILVHRNCFFGCYSNEAFADFVQCAWSGRHAGVLQHTALSHKIQSHTHVVVVIVTHSSSKQKIKRMTVIITTHNCDFQCYYIQSIFSFYGYVVCSLNWWWHCLCIHNIITICLFRLIWIENEKKHNNIPMYVWGVWWHVSLAKF